MQDPVAVEPPVGYRESQGEPHLRGSRRLKLYLAIASIVLLLGTGMAAARIMRAGMLMYSMTYAHPPLVIRAYSKLFRHATTTRDLWIQGSRGPLQLRIMAPTDLPNAPVMVLVHGFAISGMRDPLLNAFAQRLARNGLKIVMPDITSEKAMRIDPTAVTDIDDAIRWSAMSSGQKVSVFGISFSGGMVITASANPAVADDVKTTFCVSGYNSIPRVGVFYLREPVLGPDGRPYFEQPTPDALALIAFQYLDELVPGDEISTMHEALLSVLKGKGSIGPAEVPGLTAEQRGLLEDLLAVKTERMRTRYHAVLERHRAEWDSISPMGKIGNLRGSLYVLHGSSDGRIPVEEAEWTRAEGAKSGRVNVMISPWINHSVLVPRAPFTEKVRVVYFVSKMLNEAFHPVPLGATKG